MLSRARKVLMIHDVTAETYPRLTLPSRAAELLWKAKVAVGRWQADAIVTVSDFARRGIAERYKTAPERVFVVGEASDPIFRPLDRPAPTPRLAGLGIGAEVVRSSTWAASARTRTWTRWWPRLPRWPRGEFADVRLVMVGKYQDETFHSSFGALRDQIERLGLASRILFTGYIPDEELVVLLNLATVLVLPSWMEGFGLPAIEAAACGCPGDRHHSQPASGAAGRRRPVRRSGPRPRTDVRPGPSARVGALAARDARAGPCSAAHLGSGRDR